MSTHVNTRLLHLLIRIVEKEDSLACAIHNVQDNYKGQELTGTCQLKDYTDNTHLFGKKTEQRHSTWVRSW